MMMRAQGVLLYLAFNRSQFLAVLVEEFAHQFVALLGDALVPTPVRDCRPASRRGADDGAAGRRAACSGRARELVHELFLAPGFASPAGNGDRMRGATLVLSRTGARQ
ncbi:MAG: hypothetical protein IPJ33_15880 [Gammaproteobacteria bacterium]|nr:hypothetical protein [Gammaproteobacteria bacterium]